MRLGHRYADPIRVKQVLALVRAIVPARVRSEVRAFVSDFPYRLRDFPADLRSRFSRRSPLRLPPARLRASVGTNSSRAQFLAIGRRCAADLVACFEHARDPGAKYPVWLDFGCGCGRIARHLLSNPEIDRFVGTDIDTALVSWCARHLPGRWEASSLEPPLLLPEASIDVVVAVSVFTHLPQGLQRQWLAELHRVLRPGGLLLVSTHPPSHASHLPAPYALDPQIVEVEGFAHVPSAGAFNHQSSFQSRGYMQRTWSPRFRLVQFIPSGLAGYQDLSVWAA